MLIWLYITYDFKKKPLWLMVLWISVIVAYKLMLFNLCLLAYDLVWYKVCEYMYAYLCVHVHISKCTCLYMCLKPSFLPRKMLIVWMLEQTVFTPFQMRLQVIGPYAVFFRNLIYCQHISTHGAHDYYISCLSPVVSLRFAWNGGMGMCGEQGSWEWGRRI